jgi:hypothetical protein
MENHRALAFIGTLGILAGFLLMLMLAGGSV